MTPTATLTVRMHPSALERIGAMARATGMTRNALIVHLIDHAEVQPTIVVRPARTTRDKSANTLNGGGALVTNN